jgi:hypothetical protein
MKIERTLNGNINVLNSNDTIKCILPTNRIIYPVYGETDKIAIGVKLNDINAFFIAPSEISHINGVSGTWTVQEFMVAMDNVLAAGVKVLGDPLRVISDGDYEAFVDFKGSKMVTLVETTVTGSAVEKLYYEQKCENGGEFDTLWAAVLAEEKTFVHLLDL